jgi:hypothetical protein
MKRAATKRAAATKFATTTNFVKTKAAAIGVRAHSGWAAVVAIGEDDGTLNRANPEVLARERVSVVEPRMVEPGIRGAKQPYHHVMEWKIPAAEKYLAKCEAIGQKKATAALRKMAEGLHARGYTVAGCAVLQGSGRPLPELARILAAHPLIHTAEGIFFRRVFQDACERLGWRVLGVREKELDEQARLVLGKDVVRAKKKIAGMGKKVGAPWTADQKMAALAAWMVLGEKR